MLVGITKENEMNTEQRRRELIEQLYTSADPGTFSNLDQLSLEELLELASIMDPDT